MFSEPYFGFGGHIMVTDIVGSPYIGNISLNSVELIELGQMASDFYAISIQYTSDVSTINVNNTISNSAIQTSYAFAIYASSSPHLNIINNTITESYDGGIYIDDSCLDVLVSGNLALFTRASPARLTGQTWIVPLATYTFNSYNGLYINNIAAGSFDAGFAVTMSVFTGYDGGTLTYSGQTAGVRAKRLAKAIQSTKPCQVIRDINYVKYDKSKLIPYTLFSGNEAVACRVGLIMVTKSTVENKVGTCAVVAGFKAWRNAHVGVTGVDIMVNVHSTDLILAENHIGHVLSFYRFDAVYSGLTDSTIIGALGQTACTTHDTVWSSQKCQVFTQDDVIGSSHECWSVLGSGSYTRVGIMASQATNGIKTCGVSNKFQDGYCNPYQTPWLLCSLPWYDILLNYKLIV